MTTKFYKVKAITWRRKLLSPMNENWTNIRLTDEMSKLESKRADGSLAKKRPLKKLVS